MHSSIVTRNGKIVWNTDRLDKNLLCYVESYRAAENTGDDFKKNIAFPKGNKLFAGDFRVNLDETNTDKVQFTKRWNWKWILYHKDTFAESLLLQMPVLHQSMSIFQSSRLVSQVHMMAVQHVKKKELPDVSDTNQNVESTYNSKLKFS